MLKLANKYGFCREEIRNFYFPQSYFVAPLALRLLACAHSCQQEGGLREQHAEAGRKGGIASKGGNRYPVAKTFIPTQARSSSWLGLAAQ